MLDVDRPEDDWNCKSEAQPKFVTKHGHRVAGMAVTTRVRLGYLVIDTWIRRLRTLMPHVIHFNL